jgi:methyl-accepting chemotaxis protein
MLKQYFQMVPMLHDVLFGKGAVALYDCEKFIEMKQGSRITMPIKVGDIIPESSGAYDSIHQGKRITQEFGAEVYGVAYYTIAYPIVTNGEIIGGIAIAISSEMVYASQKLQDMSHELASSMEQISAAIETIAISAQQLATNGQNVSESSMNVNIKAEEMDEVVRYIDSVACDTKLLGLNASIEAARAGEFGKGFGVVASEIRSMAVASAGSGRDIRKLIGGIRKLIGHMADELDKFGGNTQEVAASIQEIGASVESLTQTAEQLAEMAEKL